jgi:hypothetical protein
MTPPPRMTAWGLRIWTTPANEDAQVASCLVDYREACRVAGPGRLEDELGRDRLGIAAREIGQHRRLVLYEEGGASPGDCRTGSECFGAAYVAAGTVGASGEDGDVADLAGHTLPASVSPAVDDHGSADPVAAAPGVGAGSASPSASGWRS